jgi:hypothetical protein
LTRPLGAAAALIVWLALAGSAPALAPLGVRGTAITAGGRPVVPHGVNRSGLEYMCMGGGGFFDSPHPDRIDDGRMIAAMAAWRIDMVRVPLNEDCWLGVNAPRRYSGAPYRRVVGAYVAALHRAGLYVVLDLHWAAPGRVAATGQLPMPDADHAPRFWASVGRAFRRDQAVSFDLFNEPYGVGWSCWLRGCEIPASGSAPAYRAAGMQALLDAVRGTGSRQPVVLGGLDYASDDWQMPAHLPRDPRHALIASQHNYGGLSPCEATCRSRLAVLRRHLPVLLGEMGETDCRHGYIDSMMRFADAQRIGYLGWAWDAVAPGGWQCGAGPSLITDYQGDPTGFGIGLRDHLRALAHR